MSPSTITFLGVDLSGGRNPLTYAALNQDCQVTALAGGEMEDLLSFLKEQAVSIIAVNAPPRPNLGLVRQRLEKQGAAHLRGADLRLAEYELKQRGISISATPGRETFCPPWIRLGFSLHQALAGMNFKPYPTPASSQVLETHPHAAFCALIGSPPLPKPTLEGRLQRQAILFEKGVRIKDPMEFFEEITRHKLVRGALPMELIYTAEELDAIAAAYIAYLARTEENALEAFGDKKEGQIFLPAGVKENC